jgi:tetratricopeptide (TPR) repeat protein
VNELPTTGSAAVSRRQVRERYKHVRDDHLRYMQKWGLIRPLHRAHGETFYAFADLALIRDADAALAEGASFRAVLRSLLASREGQLTFDFRLEAAPAKVLQLRRPEPPPLAALMEAPRRQTPSSAEHYFEDASQLDDGDPSHADGAAALYRKALAVDPYLVPALINLANIHYARDEIAEAQALYERAIAIEDDIFEAHFNLGNIFHDLGRYAEAQACYRDALALNPAFADAHFYLAVTLEKNGQSQDAKPHWRAYQQLAPNGEWVDLAREFSD